MDRSPTELDSKIRGDLEMAVTQEEIEVGIKLFEEG